MTASHRAAIKAGIKRAKLRRMIDKEKEEKKNAELAKQQQKQDNPPEQMVGGLYHHFEPYERKMYEHLKDRINELEIENRVLLKVIRSLRVYD